METVDFSKKVYVVMSELVKKGDATHSDKRKYWIRESTWEKEIDSIRNSCARNGCRGCELMLEFEQYPPYEVVQNGNGTYRVMAMEYEYVDSDSNTEGVRDMVLDKTEVLVDGIATKEEAERIKELYYYQDLGAICPMQSITDTHEERSSAVSYIAVYLDCNAREVESILDAKGVITDDDIKNKPCCK